MLPGDDKGIDAAHVINIINLIDRCFSNVHIFWLVPLQSVYPKHAEQKASSGRAPNKDDYIIRLSSHLHTLNKSMLSWDKVLSLADDVVKTMKKKDIEYHTHLTTIVNEGMMQTVDVHNFAYEILIKGNVKKSIKIWNELEKKKRRNWKQNELQYFADVEIYLRKWISECFVAIYTKTAQNVTKFI